MRSLSRNFWLLLLAAICVCCQSAPPSEQEYQAGARSVAEAARSWTEDVKNTEKLKQAIQAGDELQEKARGTALASSELFRNVSLLTSVMRAVAADLARGEDPNGYPSSSNNSRKESVQQGITLVEMALPGGNSPSPSP